MRALSDNSMCMVGRSSCLTQQLSEVRLYRLKLSNQNLNTIRSGVLLSFEGDLRNMQKRQGTKLREQKRGVERPINPAMRAKLLWDQYYCILEGQMYKAERNGKRYTYFAVQQYWFMGLFGPQPSRSYALQIWPVLKSLLWL